MATNGPFLRGDAAWMKRAMTSFPVPDSPCRQVVTSVTATRAARSMTSDHALDLPTRQNADRGSRPELKLFASSVALMTSSKAYTAQVRLEATSHAGGVTQRARIRPSSRRRPPQGYLRDRRRHHREPPR